MKIASDPKRVNLQLINVVFFICFEGYGEMLPGERPCNGDSGSVG